MSWPGLAALALALAAGGLLCAGAAPVVPAASTGSAAVTPASSAVATAPAALPALPRVGPRQYGARPGVAQMAALGAAIFRDPGLSASGRQACASCHDPAHDFGPPNARAVQLGGADLKQPGLRAVPSLKYLQATLPFQRHYSDEDDLHGEDAGPTGGLTWDGRANSPHEQALLPLFSPFEMANRDVADLAAKVRRAPYAKAFRAAFSAPGRDVFADPRATVAWLAMALEVYQQDARTFYPFTSKFDAVLRGQAALTPQEARGLALFNDPNKGNCASCHPSARSGADGGFPLFSDAGHIAIAAPRNAQEIPADADPAWHDLGLCGPLRTDLAGADGPEAAELCGRFKAPTLRNTARRQVYFHNGALHSLREVLEFYVDREIHPARWYGAAGRYDDLPARYHANVSQEVPFAPLPDGRPRLSAADIEDLLAFLGTLDDGWRPGPAR